MTEAAFQRAVLDAARATGWLAAHFRPARTERGWRTPVSGDGQGFPDCVLSHPRHGVIFAELKSERGRVSPAQQAWHDSLAASGARIFVWRPSDLHRIGQILLGAAPLAAVTAARRGAQPAAPGPSPPTTEAPHAA